MFSLAIIGLYTALFLWISTLQAAQWVGQRTNAWDLRGRPVLGALLPGAMLERVGAGNLPGFGREPDLNGRLEQQRFLVDRTRSAIDQLRATPADEADAVRRQWALGGRTLADLPADELEELERQARAELAAVIEGRTRASELRRVADRLASLDALVAAHAAAPDGAEREDAGEDVGLVVDEALELLERAGADVTGEEAFVALRQRAEALLDYEPVESPAISEDQAATLRSALVTAEESVSRADAMHAAEAELITDRIFPRPEGVAAAFDTLRLSLGTDRQGRSILMRSLYSAKIAIQVGLVVGAVCVVFGGLLGSAAAFFGGWVDHAVIWLYSTLSSIPSLVLLAVLVYMFVGSPVEGTLIPLYAAFCMTYWIGPCRVIRGEVLKIRGLEYVQAATALGFGRPYILVRHVLPNTVHLLFIQFSLLFIAAVKGEVILTYLGLGLKDGASWGIMIQQSQPEVVTGFFWQIGAATVFMMILVLAFNVFSDALQDAFDPKHVG
jgi:peptide/nickel transport system permease protein